MTEPPISIRAAHDSGGGNLPPSRVVIHSTCPSVGYPAASAPGAQHGTALYFAQASSGGSAHYVEGVDGEEHCVPEAVIAWHAPPNAQSLGIEICSEGGDYALDYTRDQWLSPQVWPAVQRAAARARDLCQRYGIPMLRLSSADLLAGKHGICGHVDVSQAWHQSTHSDPGPNFPWDQFMAEVTAPTGGFLMALSDADQQTLFQRVGDLAAFVDWWLVPDTPGATGPNSKGELTKRIRDMHGLVAALAAQKPGTITAADIAAAIPADIAQQVIDALGQRINGPQNP